MKKYLIKESQYNQLIELKRNKKVAATILSKIDRANKSLNESIIFNEAVKDILLVSKKKGLLNETVINILIESGKVSKSQINRI